MGTGQDGIVVAIGVERILHHVVARAIDDMQEELAGERR